MSPTLTPTGRLSQALGGAKVTFDPFRDAKIVWMRRWDGLEVRVSDYFITAPDAVLDALGRSILRTRNGIGDSDDDDAVIGAWMMSSDYREANRELFLRRSRRVDTERDASRLYDVYDRMLREGTAKRIDNLLMFWAGMPDGTPSPVAAEASTVMRVISVNPVLADSSDEVIESVLSDCLTRMSAAIDEKTISYDKTHSLVLGGDIRSEMRR